MDIRLEKEGAFTELFDAYGGLLTEKQRDMCSLYLEYDLSLSEIGENKGISRQSVSDCLKTSCEQLKSYEERLGYVALKKRFETYRERVERATAALGDVSKEGAAAFLKALNEDETGA